MMTRVAIDPGITNKKHTPVLSGLGVLLYKFGYLDIPYSLDILPLSVGYRKRRKKSTASMCFCRNAERSGSDSTLLMERRSRCRWVPGKRRKDRFGSAESAERNIFDFFETQKGAERESLVGWVTYAPCHANLMGGWLDLLQMSLITLACIQAVFCFETVLEYC